MDHDAYLDIVEISSGFITIPRDGGFIARLRAPPNRATSTFLTQVFI